MDRKPSEFVAAGYDQIADQYLSWTVVSPLRLRWLECLSSSLPTKAKILDLGCGAGIPAAHFLANEGYDVTGIDGSERQIALARRNVPQSKFIVTDMTAIELEPSSLDAVIAFYSLTHVPRDQHLALLKRICCWLKPNGIFLANLGYEDTPSWTGEWLGTSMYFSHFDAATNRSLVEEAGMTIDRAEIIGEEEQGKTVRFVWIAAHRTPSDSFT